MPLLSETIHGLANGISQQAPQLRLPDQHEDQLNVLNSVIDGLKKRPGMSVHDELVFSVSANTSQDISSHLINTSASIQYIAIFSGESVANPISLVDLNASFNTTIVITYIDPNDKTYCIHEPSVSTNEIKALTVGQNTFIINRGVTPAMDPELSPFQIPVALINVVDFQTTNMRYRFSVDGADVSSNPSPTNTIILTDDIATTLAGITDLEIRRPGQLLNLTSNNSVLQVHKHTPDVKLTTAAHKWTLSGSGTAVYYVELAAGGDPSIADNGNIRESLNFSPKGSSIAALTPNSWQYGDVDSLGFNTIYVRLSDDTDPDVKADGYIQHRNYIDFTIEVSDGRGGTAIKLIKDKTAGTVDLPPLAFDGTVIEIFGNEGNEFDNFYMKFEEATQRWRETIKPGIKFKFDANTMPRQLVRDTATTFTVSKIVWDDRLVGDENSIPDPTFIGNPIQNITFFKNRMTFLASENVVMSKAGDFFDFFATTATAVLDDDPIDIAVSTNEVATLKASAPFNNQLLLFADKVQFTLTGNNNILTPATVDINETTRFQYSSKADPVLAGPNVYFPIERGDFTELREYFVEPESLVNDASNITSHVPEFIPKDIKQIASNANKQILVLVTYDEDNVSSVYVYQYFWSGDQKVQSAWTKWDFGSLQKVIGAHFIGDDLYLILNREYIGHPNTRGDTIITKMTFLDQPKTSYQLAFEPKADFIIDTEALGLTPLIAVFVASGTYFGHTAPLTHIRFRTAVKSILQDSYDEDDSVDLAAWVAINKTTGKIFQLTRQINIDENNLFEVLDASEQVILLGSDITGTIGDYVFMKTYDFNNTFSEFFLKNENGQGINEGDYRLKTLGFKVQDTGGIQLEITPSSRDTMTHVDTGGVVGFTDPSDPNTFIRSEFVKFLVQAKNLNTTIKLSSRNIHPVNISSLSLEATYYNRARRIR